MSLTSAATRQTPVLGAGNRKLQELAERGRTGAMHGRAHGHLDGFQIQMAGLLVAGEDYPQELLYFARDFLLDCVSRFFSCAVVAIC
jgi:hypothetical protein